MRPHKPSRHFLLFAATVANDEPPRKVVVRQVKVWSFLDRLIHDADGQPSAPKVVTLFACVILALMIASLQINGIIDLLALNPF